MKLVFFKVEVQTIERAPSPLFLSSPFTTACYCTIVTIIIKETARTSRLLKLRIIKGYTEKEGGRKVFLCELKVDVDRRWCSMNFKVVQSSRAVSIVKWCLSITTQLISHVLNLRQQTIMASHHSRILCWYRRLMQRRKLAVARI